MSGVLGRVKAGWRAFQGWRRRRPFGAGMFLLPASVAVGLPPYASFRLGDVVLSIRTMGGMSALLIGALLLICAVSLWSRPQYRVAAGVTAILVSLVALVSSNLGGFLVGTALGLVGGALAVSWAPPTADEGDDDQEGGSGPSRARLTGVAVLLVGAVVGAPAASPSASSATTTAVPSGRVWVLTATALHLTGLQYHGVSTTRVGGATVEVLRFTVDRIDITSLVQVSELVDGHLGRITAPPGSVSTATGQPVELLTLRLKGTLSVLGLVGLPVDFTPDHPPPLVLPSLTFTDVTVVNTDLRHARLTISAAKITIT
ncbi:DUF6114 domain-containing protein [Saccharothrix sp. S26]|uniref:DUF6114 domain-containing protein n=1 Tax=Saccharothrix sp. S26 TaxID=2907215 RepID=UPI001F4148C6|nr:DUF6114 domain-containing protein [Saccharothrix sp. S26]MCE7000804.1 DUF6114 domain-containing protein [Saccharothrix sp. S26]